MTRPLAFTAGVAVTVLATLAGLIALAVVALADREVDLDNTDAGGAWLDQCTAGIILGRDTPPVRCQQHAGHPGDHHCWDDGVCTEWVDPLAASS